MTTLNILCVGDSLTAGSTAGMEHPYALKLRTRLQQAFPDHEIECQVEGKHGDQVTQGGFDERLEAAWSVADRPFDWAIILGGSNDINWNKPADAIIAALKQVWEFPIAEGSRVLAMTIPEYRAKIQKIDDKRAAVNDAIRSYDHAAFSSLDLYKEFPYHTMSSADRSKYWDTDGVHFSAAGYDLMGDKIADVLIPLIQSRS
ncbi:SGNH hydrolase-type esterase domain-containing protein [Microdochium trichocladiopsis]|uniref:SGNH hydrolase-type esterase domain-containing protein n=1 Tax=Microdochium trichocladiopsis TaxID=1682393 RepID=A0A9P8YI24_9PEZI|nr:SGNH hydrolase-type esterase domain-containing protein [Microdochium trichocladiopsis]KAH7040670.1 SGNH hydrolase-type esterase domain-containing protein [Microdochium trichocladiopsis]